MYYDDLICAFKFADKYQCPTLHINLRHLVRIYWREENFTSCDIFIICSQAGLKELAADVVRETHDTLTLNPGHMRRTRPVPWGTLEGDGTFQLHNLGLPMLERIPPLYLFALRRARARVTAKDAENEFTGIVNGK